MVSLFQYDVLRGLGSALYMHENLIKRANDAKDTIDSMSALFTKKASTKAVKKNVQGN